MAWCQSGTKWALDRRFQRSGDAKLDLDRRFGGSESGGAKLALDQRSGRPGSAKLALEPRFEHPQRFFKPLSSFHDPKPRRKIDE